MLNRIIGVKLQYLKSFNGVQETQFLPNSGRVDTAVWIHHLDANQTAREEATIKDHRFGIDANTDI